MCFKVFMQFLKEMHFDFIILFWRVFSVLFVAKLFQTFHTTTHSQTVAAISAVLY